MTAPETAAPERNPRRRSLLLYGGVAVLFAAIGVGAGALLASVAAKKEQARIPSVRVVQITDEVVRSLVLRVDPRIVETLVAHGCACVFGIPGAQENELWDAMKSKRLPYLLVTHEMSASYMADGYARATGRPGPRGCRTEGSGRW